MVNHKPTQQEIEEFEDAVYKGGWSKVAVNYPDGSAGVVYSSQKGIEDMEKAGVNFIILDTKDRGAY